MMDSKVLLPEPEAPTMAAVSRAARVKWISRKIRKVPLESVTLLKTCSTEIVGTASVSERATELISDMTAFLVKTPTICLGTWDCNKQHPGYRLAVKKPQAGAGSLTGRILQALRTVALLFLLSAVPWAALAQASSAPAAATPLKLLVLGDSLSAEYGLARGTGWVALLQKRLLNEKSAVTVVNASISGDTSSGGVSRLPVLLQQHRPQIVVIELGGNDALRGLSLAMTQNNLNSMALASKKAGAQVMLVAIQVPPNYGEKYRQQMDLIYEKVAKEISSVEIIGFSSPTYKGRYVDPQSLDENDRAAVSYNLDLSYNRAKSIFSYIFDKKSMTYQHQKDLLPLVKVTGRSFLAEEVKGRDIASGLDIKDYCAKHNCEKSQKVIIRFNLKD